MPGKKSGLNSKLRHLFAKIQKEFDFPTVFAVRVKMDVGLAKPLSPFRVVTRAPNPLVTEAHRLATDFPVSVSQAAIQQAVCRRETPMSELHSEVHDVPCWGKVGVSFRALSFSFSHARVRTAGAVVESPSIRGVRFKFLPKVPRKLPVSEKLYVNRWVDLDRLPLRLLMRSMDALPKKLVIRYRSLVLQKLQVKPTQVRFVGVCFGLPPAPLKVVDVEPASVGGDFYVSALVIGRRNSYYGRRVWVFVQLQGKNDYLPITLKEEML